MSGIIIKVTLEDSRPEVWRKILLPERISLADLHEVLRVVFGWSGTRTHEYYCDNESVGYLELEDESRVALDAFGPAGPGLCYIYDFRDDWRHKIQVEGADASWKARCAKVLEYQGDNFVEGIGGVERVDAPDYDPAKEKIPFRLTEVNRDLRGRTFSKCACSDAEDKIRALTCTADSSGIEWTRTADADSKIPAATSDLDGAKKNPERLQKTKTLPYEKQKRNFEKKPQEFREEDYDWEKEPQQKSPVEKRVDIWNDFCEKLAVSKNISRKSPAELLAGMGEMSVKGYIQLFGVTEEELKNAATAEEAIWNRLKSHPDYMTYLFEWSEMEQLLKFAKLPNTVCKNAPDQNIIDLVLRLGLMDISVETVNRSRFLMLRQTKGMGEILAAHTENEWRKLCEKAQTLEKQCMAIMNLYGVMSTEAFCEKYQAYYGRNTEIEEIKRCVYLGARTRGKVNVGRADIGKEVILLAGIHEIKLDSKDADAWHSLEYRTFTAKERKQASHDCWALYPAWKDLHDTLYECFNDMEESELKRWMYRQYTLTLAGSNLKELWKKLEEYCMIDTLDMESYLWQVMLGIYLTTGLAKYKGYSRQEYARLKDIPLRDVCGKFSLIDYETVVGLDRPFRSEKENAEANQQMPLLEGTKESVDREKLRRINKNTHLREFPEETQLAIYQIWTMPVGRLRATRLTGLWCDLLVENGELDYLLAMAFFSVGEYQLVMESLLPELKKNFPDDTSLDSAMQLAQENARYQKNDVEIRRLLDGTSLPAPGNDTGEMTEADNSGSPVVQSGRRMQPKVGRNDPCPCGSGKKYKKCCGR